jgi:hypothetical protein
MAIVQEARFQIWRMVSGSSYIDAIGRNKGGFDLLSAVSLDEGGLRCMKIG